MIERKPAETLGITEARQRIAATVTHALKAAPKPVSEMTSHLAASQGKGVRALLLLHAAAGPDGLVPADTVPAAAAIELLHMATLVHDDIIDDSALRRGFPTLHSRFGRKRAVICGDYLLCLAATLIAPLQANYREFEGPFAMFTAALGRTCMGELRQLNHTRNLGLNVNTYLRIVSGKTAALFSVSALAGALVARLNRAEAMRLARFGRYLGMAFQIVDDCKDYEQTEGEALKPVGKDISEGVVTLPLIYAMQASKALKASVERAFSDISQAGPLTEAVRLAGGTGKSKALAARYAEKARSLLDGLPESKARPLVELLDKSVQAANAF
jgi:heptaprenyl diphosphate synthase